MDKFFSSYGVPGCVKVGHFNSIQRNNTRSISVESANTPYYYSTPIHGEWPTDFHNTILVQNFNDSSLNVHQNNGVYAYVTSYHPDSANTLHYDSSIYMNNGYLFSTSDEAKKWFIGDIDCDFDQLKSIPKQYYIWKDGNNQRRIGTSAQKLFNVYPELVNIDDKGDMAVSYSILSIVALAAIDKLHQENLELKERLKKLEDIVYGGK